MSASAQMWPRVSPILDRLLERPEAEWPALLDEGCGADADLRREVVRLLAAHRRAEGFLSEPADGFVPALLEAVARAPQEEEPAAPQSVGPWRLLRELGRGGMGVVYLAERSGEQFRQRAALKLVRGSLVSGEGLARFRRERQILASLSHPHIARLLDGGRSDDGRPYLAMEYVEGRPLTAYCRERALGLEERLRLFLAICLAVQHAHARLVVHRDLKPSNILVTETGEPRLLDFGIAKLLAEDEEDTPALTRTGLPVMTPEYAAPEQLRGETVSTATDVYALGLILYELLAGRHPFRDRVHPAGAGELAARLEPPRPSSAVEDRTLRRRVAGDLDMIVLMALREEPARRYATADALARDVERHLAGLPVSARPDTLGYRVRKFAHRHRWGVAVTAVGAVLLVAFAATMAEQARRTARQRDRAERVSKFLVELFKVSDPLKGSGEGVTAREILDRGSERIERELASEPEVQGDLMDTMGRVYQSLGLMDRSEHLFRRAVDVRGRALGADDARTLRSMSALGNILVREGHGEAGVRVLADTLRLERGSLGPDHDDTLATMNDLAFWLGALGRYAEAEELHRDVLERRRRLHGAESGEVVWSVNDLGVVLMREGRNSEAEALLNEAIGTLGRIKKPGNNNDVFNEAILKSNLASIHQRQRRYGEAERMFIDVLASIKRMVGADNLHTLLAVKDLAAFYCVTGRYAESEKLGRDLIPQTRRVLGPRHTDTLQAMYWQAVVYREQGRLAEAETLQTETLDLQRQELGAEHPDTLSSMGNLGRVLGKRGRLEEAEKILGAALDVQRRRWGARHPDASESLYGMACLAALADRRSLALERLRQAVDTGHQDPDRLAREPDLRVLAGDPEFTRLVAAARRPEWMWRARRDLNPLPLGSKPSALSE